MVFLPLWVLSFEYFFTAGHGSCLVMSELLLLGDWASIESGSIWCVICLFSVNACYSFWWHYSFMLVLKGWSVSELTSIAKYNSLKNCTTIKMSQNYLNNDQLVGWILVFNQHKYFWVMKSDWVLLNHSL